MRTILIVALLLSNVLTGAWLWKTHSQAKYWQAEAKDLIKEKNTTADELEGLQEAIGKKRGNESELNEDLIAREQEFDSLSRGREIAEIQQDIQDNRITEKMGEICGKKEESTQCVLYKMAHNIK
ncbi:MAG: hypothetical protein HC852_01640 [Acaryochloridaceae cyanobacterium RU_4_10]|nr:hypothetical protein [Acaryochloridaceae cyanobacterium RU_4_10]